MSHLLPFESKSWRHSIRIHPMTPAARNTTEATMTMAFIDQASRYIRLKLQMLQGLQGKLLRDLVKVAEKVYHNWEKHSKS